MVGYTKLFGSLLASTIWREDDKVRIVWITLLAMADKRGIAEGSIPGIADLARVSVEDCERALARLQEPDRFSRSTGNEGRRIAPTDGGFQILNHAKYRDRMSVEERREYRQKWMAERRAAGFCEHGVNTREHGVNSCERCEHIQKQKQKQYKNPPTPLERGARVTRAHRKHAEQVIKLRFGGCRHDPKCANYAACVEATARELAEKAS